MSFRLQFVAVACLFAASFSTSSFGAGSAKRIKNITYSKKSHESCQKKWPAPCSGVNDKNGDLFLCLSQPNVLANLSDSCLGVVLEIGNWAPKSCVTSSMDKVCSDVAGDALTRLDCAAYRTKSFPKACRLWTEGAGRTVKEYRSRTGIKS